MIRFRCICHKEFEVPEDRAGNSFQCPNCGRAVDVPLLSEIPTISEDGTYKVDETPEAVEGDRLEKLQRAFTQHRVDEYGREIDLRLTPDEIDEVGEAPVPLEDEKPAAPKYDPVTGELIQELDVKASVPNPSAATVPWVRPSIHYASGEVAGFVSAWQIIPELFRISNLAVIAMIFAIHFFVQLMMFPIFLRMLLLLPFAAILMAFVMAHYANVIEEVGPLGRDELPRPMRDMTADDLWWPFINFMTALVLCYSILVPCLWLPKPMLLVGLFAVAGLGTFFFPAVLLTATTSGSILNLRPDRVLGVVRACGAGYLVLVIMWVVAASVYFAGFLGTLPVFAHFAEPALVIDGLFNPLITETALIVGIILTNGWCWHLGLMYREHQHEFPWVLQSHVSTAKRTPKRGFEVRKLKRPPSAGSATMDGGAEGAGPVAPLPVLPVRPAQPSAPTPAISRYEIDDSDTNA